MCDCYSTQKPDVCFTQPLRIETNAIHTDSTLIARRPYMCVHLDTRNSTHTRQQLSSAASFGFDGILFRSLFGFEDETKLNVENGIGNLTCGFPSSATIDSYSPSQSESERETKRRQRAKTKQQQKQQNTHQNSW